MAVRLADGSIQMSDGRIIYANTIILGQDLCEIIPLCVPPPAWPFVSGGGGGGSGTPGARGADGAPGAPGVQGPQGTNPGVQGPQGSQGRQGFQGSVGPQGSQGLIGTQGTQGTQGFQGALSPDLFAATRIVSLIPGEGTDLTIVAAIAALPAEGGTIFVKQGTYPITVPIILPDKNVDLILSGGTILTLTGAITLFSIPNGLTAIRKYIVSGAGQINGDLTVGQTLITLSDTGALGKAIFEDLKITGIETLINITAGDNTNYAEAVEVLFENCFLPPPNLAGAKLIQCVNANGVYAFPSVATFVRCNAYDKANLAFGWSFVVDVDVVLIGSIVQIKANSGCDGLSIDPESDVYYGGGGAVKTLAYNGWAWITKNGIQGTIEGINLIVNNGQDVLTISLFGGSFLTMSGDLNSLNIRDMNYINGIFLVAATPAVIVDVLAGADNTSIRGFFHDATTAAIRTAAQRTRVVDCSFTMTLTHQTILEAGAADFTLVTGCIGIASGGSFSIPGANSLVGADNIG